MKKLMLFLTLMMTLALLTGCAAGPSVAPAKLSDDAQELVDLLGRYSAIYDLKLTKDVRSVHVNLYRLQDGQWQLVSGGGMPVQEMEQRIILWIDQASGQVTLSNSGSKVSFTTDALDIPERSVGASRLADKSMLEWEKEVPLFLYVETGADRMDFAVSDFYHPEKLAQHERVYALTVMVSQEEAK